MRYQERVGGTKHKREFGKIASRVRDQLRGESSSRVRGRRCERRGAQWGELTRSVGRTVVQ